MTVSRQESCSGTEKGDRFRGAGVVGVLSEFASCPTCIVVNPVSCLCSICCFV